MIIVFDADNTLYDFLAFYAPYFRSAVHIISKETGLPEDAVTADLRSIYEKYGTLEYQFLLQDSALLRGIDLEKMSSLEHILSVAARLIRQKRLLLYQGVNETLERITQANVLCVAVTNAPFYQIDLRFKHLGLHRYFDSLLCATSSVTNDEVAKAKYEKRRAELRARFSIFRELDKDDQKPSSRPYEIVRDYYGNHDRFVAVGDSLEKDLRPASKVDFTTVWARYGTDVRADDLDTVLEVTPWSAVEVESSKSELFEPDYVLDRFSDIIDALRIPYQRSFFD